MSSGRLFLDRVARQQSPSLLHRQPQDNTHSSGDQGLGDISTLPGRGHFYFALTVIKFPIALLVEMAYTYTPCSALGRRRSEEE